MNVVHQCVLFIRMVSGKYVVPSVSREKYISRLNQVVEFLINRSANRSQDMELQMVKIEEL